MIQRIRDGFTGVFLGLFIAFLVFKSQKPDVSTKKDETAKVESSSSQGTSLALAKRKSTKATAPNGASIESIEESFQQLDTSLNVSKSSLWSKSSEVTQSNLLNIYIGGGVDISLENPRPRFAGLVTYGNHAGQVVSDMVKDHSGYYHYRILSF